MLPMIRRLTLTDPSLPTSMPLPTDEPEPATPRVPIMLFWILPFTVLANGGFPLLNWLIACARPPVNVLFVMLKVRRVLTGSVETLTPTLLFVNAAPDTITVMLGPPALPKMASAVAGAAPTKEPPETFNFMLEEP